MNDPELKALGDVTKVLADLNEEQRQNVLLYINSRYGGELLPRSRRGMETKRESAPPSSTEFTDLGDFFDASNPQTEAERVLVVGYWLQVIEGADDFESYPVNKHLKNLGHPVSNITRAFESMIDQAPRLILQTSKSGSAKQARKRYKVTREGVKRVQAMLAQTNGDGNDE